MSLPQRPVKYIVEGALRRIGECNENFSTPDNGTYNDVFNIYLDMLVEFNDDGYLPDGYKYPASIESSVGYEIPMTDQIAMLARRSATFFSMTLTRQNLAEAGAAYSRVALNLTPPKISKNPIPNRYRFYDRPTSCHNEDSCEAGCNGGES